MRLASKDFPAPEGPVNRIGSWERMETCSNAENQGNGAEAK